MAPKLNHISHAIAYYSLCSSILLIVNKVALQIIPAPVYLLSLQLWFAVALVYTHQRFGTMQIEKLCWSTAIKFFPVVLSFLGTLFSNAKILQYSNVETFITFRASTPLALSVCDYLFLGRQWPSSRSVGCLVGLLMSCAGYAMFDHDFDVRAYAWLGVWYACFTIYEVVVKRLCDTIAIDNWTRVIYTNAMAGSLLLFAIPFARSEREIIATVHWTWTDLSILATSCMVGIGVSHSAYVMRSSCSATLSAVVGILCKVLTVLINLLIWDKHASMTELGFLAIGLVSGAFYVPAPLRSEVLARIKAGARCVKQAGEDSSGQSADAEIVFLGPQATSPSHRTK